MNDWKLQQIFWLLFAVVVFLICLSTPAISIYLQLCSEALTILATGMKDNPK